MTAAALLLKGTWTARWGNWVVELTWKSAGWEVTVWRQRPGKKFRYALGTHEGYQTIDEAVAEACKIMRADGAQVLILDAPNMTLESALSFRPELYVLA